MLALGSNLRRLLFISYRAEDKKFAAALGNPRAAFAAKYAEYSRVLPELSNFRDYADFADRQAPTQYSDIAPQVEAALAAQKKSQASDTANSATKLWSGDTLVRFEATSGSTEKRKFIPYNRRFLNELDRALGPWLADLARQYPRTLHGRHYWSLSWVPQAERDEGRSNNDTELFAWWKRPLLSLLMAVPQKVGFEKTNHDWMISTLKALVTCPDLTLISVWSPTFFIQLANGLIQYRAEVIHGLKNISSSKARRAVDLLSSHAAIEELLPALWPELGCVSCWDSASSQQFMPTLKQMLPSTPIQGKGLWATEGVVTIPYGGRHVPALTSHLLEFFCESRKRILRPWELEPDQIVRPLITNGSGMLRYDLKDRLKVRSLDAIQFPISNSSAANR